jgi:Tol biopolymer transport system component
MPQYSHSGRFISCYAGDKIRIVTADTGKVISELIPETSLLTNTPAHWTEDDKYLVYRVIRNGSTNLWRQPVAGGEPRQLTKFPKGDLYNFCYSYDGRKLYVSRGAQIRNAILIQGFR